MKTRIPVVLALAAALALAACAPAQTADAPQNGQTAESAQTAGTAPAQETAALPAVAGELYALAEDGAQTCLFNAGDCGYQMLWQNDHGLVTVIDYAAAEQRVLCSVPGCDHASEDCPAYFPGIRHHYKLFAAGDAVYVYKQWAGEYMPATWEEYYETNLAGTLAEDAQTFGQTPEEYLAWQRAVYRSSTDPASLMVITGGGAAKHILELSQNLGSDSILRWCDGAALYGYSSGALTMGARTGYRVSLADGSVTEFPLQENEWPCGVMGQNLLVDQFLTDAPLPDPDQNREAYDAALQNGYYAYYLLDPATGVRTPLLVDRMIVSDTGFRGQAGGWLYFATMQRDGAGVLTRIGLRVYDTATGQWQDIAGANGNILDAEARALPGAAAQEGRWLWLESAAETPEAPNTAWVLDRQSGERYAVAQTIEAAAPVDRTMFAAAVTDDGRFLLPLREKEPYVADYDYGLIAIDAFLQGSTDYTPVQMLA